MKKYLIGMFAAALLWAPAAIAQDDSMPGSGSQDQPAPQPQPAPEEQPKPAPQPQPAEQPKPAADPYAWVDGQINRISTLSDEQKKQLIETLKEMLKKIDELRKETQAKVKESLGDETFGQVERSLRRFFSDSSQGQGQGRGQGGQGGQGGPGGGFGGMSEQFVTRAKEELGLTDEQSKAFQDLSTKFQESVGQLFRDAQGQGRNGFRDAFTKVQEEFNGMVEKMKEGLSDEQKTKLDGIVEQFRSRFGGRRGGGGGGGGNRGGGGDQQPPGGGGQQQPGGGGGGGQNGGGE